MGRYRGTSMTTDELLFFYQLPRFLPVYEALKAQLRRGTRNDRQGRENAYLFPQSLCIRYGIPAVSAEEGLAEGISAGLFRAALKKRIAPHRTGGGGVSGPLDAPCGRGAGRMIGRGAAGLARRGIPIFDGQIVPVQSSKRVRCNVSLHAPHISCSHSKSLTAG